MNKCCQNCHGNVCIRFPIASITLSIHVIFLESELNDIFPLTLMGLGPTRRGSDRSKLHFYFRFSAIITPWEEAGWQNLTFLLSLDNTAWKRPGTPVYSLSLPLWLSLIIAVIVRIWWEGKPKRLLSWNLLFSGSSLTTHICYPSVRDIPCHWEVNRKTYVDLCGQKIILNQ